MVGGKPSAATVGHAVTPLSPGEYGKWHAETRTACDAFAGEIASLDERFDEGLTRWGSWRLARADQLEHWARTHSDSADSAATRLNYLDRVQELEHVGGHKLVARIHALTAAAEASIHRTPRPPSTGGSMTAAITGSLTPAIDIPPRLVQPGQHEQLTGRPAEPERHPVALRSGPLIEPVARNHATTLLERIAKGRPVPRPSPPGR